MALETGDYISDLNATNPVGATDPKSQGDDHLRLIKKVLKQTFPNLSGAMTATQSQLSLLASTTNDRVLRVTGGAANMGQLTAGMFPNTVVPDAALSNNVPLLSTLNTFLATQRFHQADAIELGLRDTTAAANTGNFGIQVSDNIMYFLARLDNGTLGEQFITATRNSAGEFTALAFAADVVTINGVSSANFARLDNSGNSFLGNNQQINATGATFAQWRLQADSSVGWFGVSDASGGFIGGDAAGDAGVIGSNGVNLAGNGGAAVHCNINSSGNFDFKAGTVTTNNANAREVGYKGAPSVDTSSSANTAASAAGATIRLTGGSGQTFTLDGDPPEDSIVVIDNDSGNSWTIAASGTLIWAATAGTGNRTLAADGMAVALHRGSGVWIINGGGLS